MGRLLAASLLVLALGARGDGAGDAAPAGELTPGDDVAPEDVDGLVRAQRPAVDACYLEGLKKHPRLHGRVVLRFTIRPSGEVGDVAVKATTLKARDVEACIVAVAQAWRTTLRPASPVTVEIPFTFSVR